MKARQWIGHQLQVPTPDRLEHDANQAWLQGPLAALDRLIRTDIKVVAVASIVPTLTAIDSAGRLVVSGLLYGNSWDRVPADLVSPAQLLPPVGEAAEFLCWTAAAEAVSY